MNENKREIRISVSVLRQPDGVFLLSSDTGNPPESARSIDDVLEVIDGWARMRLAQADAKDAKIIVDLSYPALAFQ